MRTSFLEYAYSVIYSRALPDARDGLKPVQRRILHTMAEMGLRPDRGHVKSARVVGEVMGRLHPHGDGAIYDALVRMVQPWSLRLPMVDGHGNFGSPDEGPAAMRYTECRLAAAAVPMTASIDEDTVDFKPNYDSRETEPTVLPAAIPNLLVNGAAGIAVGMATNMAPHNLVEVVQALRHLVTHPNADLDALMRFIPGPDLPTGGKIIGLGGIRDAYESGRGTFKMRATVRVENVTPRRKGLVVTELPYGVGPEKVIERIKTLVLAKKLQGISDVKDLTDLANGLNLVIEVKNGFHPEAILEQLYRLTPMEDSFGINAVTLVDGQPRTLGLKELLEVYLQHRYDVVRRRSAYRRARAAERLHLVEGLLVAILDIDEVIQLIRSSDDGSEAKARLMSVFDLDDPQATYILDLQLRRLTKFSRIELEKEKDELEQRIAALDEILDDETKLRAVVSDELAEIAKAHGTPRRTVLLQSAGQPSAAALSLEVTDDPCFVFLSSAGLLARSQSDETPGAGEERSGHDVIVSVVRATARGHVGVVTTGGRVVRLDVVDLPALPPTANAPHLQGGAPLSTFLQLEGDERALALTTLTDQGPGLALGTRQGVVKRVNPELLSRDAWEVVRLADGDEVVGAVELTTGEEELCFVTSDAQLLHFDASAVRPQGRSGGGIAGCPAGRRCPRGVLRRPQRRRRGATSRAAVVVTVSGSSTALPGTEPGSVKVTPFSGVPRQGACHRRCPLPPLPQGRGHARARLGRTRPRDGGGRVGLPGGPAACGRAARRLRNARVTAGRRRRLTGP